MEHLLMMSGIIFLGGIAVSYIVLLINLFEDAVNTEAVVTPTLAALAMSLCICTLGLPVILALIYRVRQKVKHPDSKIW